MEAEDMNEMVKQYVEAQMPPAVVKVVNTPGRHFDENRQLIDVTLFARKCCVHEFDGQYPWRTTWVLRGTKWQKIEDQASWRRLRNPEDNLYHGSAVEIVTADELGIRVSCGEGQLVITEAQLPGAKAQSVATLLRGNQARFQPGRRLGDANLT